MCTLLACTLWLCAPSGCFRTFQLWLHCVLLISSAVCRLDSNSFDFISTTEHRCWLDVWRSSMHRCVCLLHVHLSCVLQHGWLRSAQLERDEFQQFEPSIHATCIQHRCTACHCTDVVSVDSIQQHVTHCVWNREVVRRIAVLFVCMYILYASARCTRTIWLIKSTSSTTGPSWCSAFSTLMPDQYCQCCYTTNLWVSVAKLAFMRDGSGMSCVE